MLEGRKEQNAQKQEEDTKDKHLPGSVMLAYSPCPNDEYELETRELIFFKKRIWYVDSEHMKLQL